MTHRTSIFNRLNHIQWLALLLALPWVIVGIYLISNYGQTH